MAPYTLIRGVWRKYTRVRQVSCTQVRAVSARKRHPALFNASRLLLDLDAADSSHVRKHEDSGDELLGRPVDSAKGPELLIRSPVRRTWTSTPGRTKNFLATTSIHPRTTPPLAPDYIATALLGQTAGSSHQAGQRARWTAHHPHTKSITFYESLVWMQDGAAAPSMYNKDSLGHSEGILNALKTLSSARTKIMLNSAIAAITESSEGCEALAINPRVIEEALRKVAASEDLPAKWALKFMSNLVTKLQSKVQQSNTTLFDLCLFYAAKARCLPALYRYVAIATQRHDSHRKLRLAALATTLSWTSARDDPDPIPRKEILRLATGWDSGGVPSSTEKRKISLAKLVEKDSALYNCYVQGLGDIGAVEALWYEWTHPEALHMTSRRQKHNMSIMDISGLYNVPSSAATSLRRIDVFVDAFLKAGDFRRAQQVLGGRVGLDEQIKGGSREPQFPGAMNPESRKNDALQVMLLEHYIRHDAKAVTGDSLRADARRLRAEHNTYWGNVSALESILGVEASSERSQDLPP